MFYSPIRLKVRKMLQKASSQLGVKESRKEPKQHAHTSKVSSHFPADPVFTSCFLWPDVREVQEETVT